ncbi:HAD family acid phosphatase [Streptomyces sp. NPDC002851]
MRKPVRLTLIATACALAGGALYGTGAALAEDAPERARAADTRTSEPHNIGVLVQEIDDYYGTEQDENGYYHASLDSPYAKDMARIVADAKRHLAKAAEKARKSGAESERPAIVFDIDDTLLLSLDYEKKTNFTYDSEAWDKYVAQADRPAVFGTTELIAYAEKKGIEVFYNTGLAEKQRSAAVENLKKNGVDINLDADHMFLKDKQNPPAYLSHCAAPGDWKCTTVQYKSGTRKHIESQGYDIVGNFGDQRSDLDGGYADRTFKFPNPTYFVE